MTREELREHCIREIDWFEKFGYKKVMNCFDKKRYEEHKLVLELLEQEPCEDAISRQATVDFLENHAETYEDVRVKMGFKASASLINNRNNLPPVTPTQNWIPTSERQPEENGEYLVTVKRGYVTTALWVGDAEFWSEVEAWMPLPKPYKAGSVEE